MIRTNRDEGSLFTPQFYDFAPQQMLRFPVLMLLNHHSSLLQARHASASLPFLTLVSGSLTSNPLPLPLVRVHHSIARASDDRRQLVLRCHSSDLVIAIHENCL